MAHVVDVAAYVLECLGSVSTMKLQKLTFYSQAYYLVEHGTCLLYTSLCMERCFPFSVLQPPSPLFARHVLSRSSDCC